MLFHIEFSTILKLPLNKKIKKKLFIKKLAKKLERKVRASFIAEL